MITGFNTDIEFDERVFHVQTEDKGLQNPMIETLVYTGGQIVCARKTSYAQMLVAGDCQESSIQQRMEAQHRELIREIQDGSLIGQHVHPFGAGVISNRAFDEVVSTFLVQSVPIENPKLEWSDESLPEIGARVCLALRVTDEVTDRPIGGVDVVARHHGRKNARTEIGQGTTDAQGRAEVECCMPSKVAKNDRVVCEALIGESVITVSKKFKAQPKSVRRS